MQKGTVFLIPIPIGDLAINQSIPQEVYNVIKHIDVFMIENIKTTRRYLRKLDSSYPIDDKIFFTVDKRTSLEDISKVLEKNSTKNIGIISEAGCPAIADPGALIVKKAHHFRMKVTPIVGPSSIFLALMASGKNGQHFTFNGYLPKERSERIKKLKQLENLSRKGIAQIFMETPFRNNHLLEDILTQCDNSLELCIASNINSTEEFIKTKTISNWKKAAPDLHKKPTIFVL